MRKEISYEDGLAIAAEVPSVENVAPFMSPVDWMQGPMAERVKIRYQDTEMVNATVQGTTTAYIRMGTINVTEGRFFTDAENITRSDVCVIGRDVANTLFPNLTAVDREISISGRNYRVVGVLQTRDNFLTPAEDPGNENKAVYLPYEYAAEDLSADQGEFHYRAGATRPDGRGSRRDTLSVAQAAERALLASPTTSVFRLPKTSSASSARSPVGSSCSWSRFPVSDF